MADAAGIVQTLKRIPWDEAVQLAGQAAYQLGARAEKAAGGQLPTDLNAALNIFSNVQDNVILPMVELFRKYGTDFNALSKIGFNDGGLLVGRLLKQKVNYDPETLQAIARIGDELGEAATDLSDDAAKYLGEMVHAAGEETTRKLLSKISCPTGFGYSPSHRGPGLAFPLFTSPKAECVKFLFSIPEGPARSGYLKIITGDNEQAEVATRIWNRYQNHPARDHLFEVINDANIINGAKFADKLETIGGIDDVDKFKQVWDLVPPGETHRLDDLVDRVVHMRDNYGIPDEFDKIADVMLKWETNPIPTSLPNTPNPSDYGYNQLDVAHYLEGHTYEYFNPLERKKGGGKVDSATFWPEGTTPDDVVDYLDTTLKKLKADGNLPSPALPGDKETIDVIISTSKGPMEVRFGVRVDDTGKKIAGQFVPITGSGFVRLNSGQIRSILPIYEP